MDVWDGILIAVAAYLAVTSLVRLMAGRRNELIDEVRAQLAQRRGANTEGSSPAGGNKKPPPH